MLDFLLVHYKDDVFTMWLCCCSCGRQTPKVTMVNQVTVVTTRTSRTDIRSMHINAEIFIICFLVEETSQRTLRTTL